MSDAHASGPAQRNDLAGSGGPVMWRRYLRFWGSNVPADVDDELHFHIEMRVRDYVAGGMTEDEARAKALGRLGDVRAVRATCVGIGQRRERRMIRTQVLDALTQDTRFALRTLGRRKGWTGVAILTLALGIGANTAVFSVVDSLILHPLSYPHAGRLALVYQVPAAGNNTGMHVMVSPDREVVSAWIEESRSFEGLQPWSTADRTLHPGSGDPAVVHTASILPSFIAFAGQRTLLGRSFTKSEAAGDAHVAMLSESVWRSRYGADPHVIGRPIVLDSDVYTIIGVVPAALRLPRILQRSTDIWLPLDVQRSPETAFLTVIGRLRPGVSRADAARELDSLVARTTKKASPYRTRLESPASMVSFRDSLLLLTGAVALVLVIACVNIAHLLLARAATRHRELAIRAALGAGRRRIARQLLTESLILAAAGCGGGILVGWLGMHALVSLRPESLSELDATHMNGTTLLVAVALAVVTGLVFGVVGAAQAARHVSGDALRAGAPASSASPRHRRFRALLVVSEMALSAMLLVGAVLLVRSVVHLQTMDPGFDPAGLYAVRAEFPMPMNDSAAMRAALVARGEFYAELAARARRIPGVRDLTVAAEAPGRRGFLIGALQVEGDPNPPPSGASMGFIDFNRVSPDYFRMMGIRLVEGTTFSDTSASSTQVIVNEGFARRRWPRGSALGKRIRVVYNGQGDWKTIVGVVRDDRTRGLTADATAPLLYFTLSRQVGQALLVRVSGGAIPITTLRTLARSINPNLPPAEVTSIADAMKSAIAGPRFTMALLAAFTVLAVVLAAIGLYGVLAYNVEQRTREIGIRMALGATRSRIARATVADGVRLGAAGMVVGLGFAVWGTKMLHHLLYGVGRTDPISFAIGGAALLLTALAACVVPTRRAVRIDPAVAMRAE